MNKGIIIILAVLIAFVVICVRAYSKKQKRIEQEEADKEDLEHRMTVLAQIREEKEQRRLKREAAAELASVNKKKTKSHWLKKRSPEEEKEIAVKMAELRKRKEEKRIEEFNRQEEFRRKQEEEEKKKVMAFQKLGLTEMDEEEYENDENLNDPDSNIGEDGYVYRCNETLNIDKFLALLRRYDLDDDNIWVKIDSTSGPVFWLFLNLNEKVFSARVEESSVKKFKSTKAFRNYVWCFCQNEQLKTLNVRLEHLLEDGVNNASKLRASGKSIEEYLVQVLLSSNYNNLFEKKATVFCQNDIALIEYELPNKSDISWVKEYKYVASDSSVRESLLPESTIEKKYESLLYSICLRSIYEVCISKKSTSIESVVYNGFVSSINKATGLKERKCILSLQVPKEQFLHIDLTNVDPKICFKSFKGVSAAKLIDLSPVQPVLSFNKNDHRFVESKDVSINSGTNLALMDWEDFEHLVRELFELEFAHNGGEVRVTQASRDGGVDAIVFDPDPLRGGKIVIQAKRYTNTVGVSAVRDLYGTVINEGANTGILITTSDYGHDSYEFAKDKPLKLLNGGHLLALLYKNGKEGYINIQEAKDSLKEE